jgi:nitrogen fixation protein NifU and related proteins
VDPSQDQELNRERILEHYESSYHRGRCERYTHFHEDTNPLCGDRVQMSLLLDSDGVFRELYFDGDGCCISQAAASMLVEKFDQSTVEELSRFTARDMLALFGMQLSPARQQCCLLAWRVLRVAVDSPTGKLVG